jgi:hypothetical protein
MSGGVGRGGSLGIGGCTSVGANGGTVGKSVGTIAILVICWLAVDAGVTVVLSGANSVGICDGCIATAVEDGCAVPPRILKATKKTSPAKSRIVKTSNTVRDITIDQTLRPNNRNSRSSLIVTWPSS